MRPLRPKNGSLAMSSSISSPSDSSSSSPRAPSSRHATTVSRLGDADDLAQMEDLHPRRVVRRLAAEDLRIAGVDEHVRPPAADPAWRRRVERIAGGRHQRHSVIVWCSLQSSWRSASSSCAAASRSSPSNANTLPARCGNDPGSRSTRTGGAGAPAGSAAPRAPGAAARVRRRSNARARPRTRRRARRGRGRRCESAARASISSSRNAACSAVAGSERPAIRPPWRSASARASVAVDPLVGDHQRGRQRVAQVASDAERRVVLVGRRCRRPRARRVQTSAACSDAASLRLLKRRTPAMRRQRLAPGAVGRRARKSASAERDLGAEQAELGHAPARGGARPAAAAPGLRRAAARTNARPRSNASVAIPSQRATRGCAMTGISICVHDRRERRRQDLLGREASRGRRSRASTFRASRACPRCRQGQLGLVAMVQHQDLIDLPRRRCCGAPSSAGRRRERRS